MPFDINSVPEIFHARMDLIVERLTRIKVYMNDFLIIERGEPQQEEVADHEHNLVRFWSMLEREDCN